jgi:hypothetical protein
MPSPSLTIHHGRSALPRSQCRGVRWDVTAVLLFLWTVLMQAVPSTRAQFNEPPGERREQTFKVLEFENSNINQRFPGSLRYYCTFRGKWSEERHPNDFPRSSSWSAPVIISHSNGYRMWTGTEAVTAGIESIAEVRFGGRLCTVCAVCGVV